MSCKKSVVVGLSGGVDSAVAALLLKHQGYDVQACFMKNWEEDDDENYCAAAQDLYDAETVCDQLNIQLHKVNFSAEYWHRVFKGFLDEIENGRTPNPDILCNTEIKFRAFLEHAKQKLGADHIATGHYAQLMQHAGQTALLRAADPSKDQSYFLHGLTQHQLASSIFPLGALTKLTVRNIAKQNQLANHAKRDSTGICFIGERRFSEFLKNYVALTPGPIETDDGMRIGEHQGLAFYTLGQRQGLGIGGIKQRKEQPWYVLEKDLSRNTLVVGQGHDHPRLLKRQASAHKVNWITGRAPHKSDDLSAQVRYRHRAVRCTLVESSDTQMKVRFHAAVRAITPGQSLVLYRNQECLGGGIIDRCWDMVE